MFPLHDRSYKRLFSHPRWFRQLLEHFVDEPWVKDLNFDRCEKMEKSFISAHYKATESDLLYQVQVQGQEAYITYFPIIPLSFVILKSQKMNTIQRNCSKLETRFQPLTPAQKQYLYELPSTKLFKLAEQLWHAQSLQDILNADELYANGHR